MSRVELAEHLRLHLDEADVEAEFAQVFGHFHADEAAADHDRRAQLLPDDGFADAQRVLHGAQRLDPRAFDARQLRAHRHGAGRKHQLVVAFGKDPRRSRGSAP